MNGAAPLVRLIVNADDLGLSDTVNRGIIHAHHHGIVTSASLMVRRPAAAAGAGLAMSEPGLSVGLHFDLGEWSWNDGAWHRTWRIGDGDDVAAVETELDAQFRLFEALLGHPPTHIDSHQHVHRDEPVRSILSRAARERGIPLRGFDPVVRYRGDFYGQARPGESMPELVGVSALMGILDALPAGITELGCHPALGPVGSSQYGAERTREAETLCDPRIRRRLAELRIELLSYRDLHAGVAAQ